MTDDDLGMLTDDQINYSTMSEDSLNKLASGDDLFVATSALVELSLRKSAYAAPLALNILLNATGDHYLQSTAWSVLYRMDPEKALNLMSEKVEIMGPYQLNSIIEIILDNEPDFKKGDHMPVVRKVFHRLKELGNVSEYLNQDIVTDLQKHFTNILNLGGSWDS